jgi:hypothetical protein
MKTQMKKYQTGGAKPKAKPKTAAELKAEGIALKKKGEAMKKAGSSSTTYTVNPKYKDIPSYGSTTAYNPKNKTVTTVNKSAADPRYTKDVKVQKVTPASSSYKEVRIKGGKTYDAPTTTVYNKKNNTITTVNTKADSEGLTRQIKVTKLKPAGSKSEVKKKAEQIVPKKGYTPVKTEVKKVEAKKVEAKKEPVKKVEVKKVAVKTEPKKVEVKQSVSTPAKSAESSVSPVLSAAIAKSTPTAPKISSETKTMMDNLSKSSSTSEPAKQKLGDRIRAKFAEAAANRRERRAEKAESKSDKMKMGGAMKKMKTGGMVNPNAAVKRQAVAGSKGVRSGVNPKAAASSVARGRVGGTSASPKTATPKAKYGMSLTKMKKR